MFNKLPMYQNIGDSAYKKDLSNIILICEHLNNPHNNFKSIHIGGTNGKGSCSHMLSSILQEADYKVGLYTSPHLVDFRERIRINGDMISKDSVSKFMHENLNFFESNNLSFFEMTVGLAFDYFSKNKVDIAVIEVGMGGRLDSTNIIKPILSIITNISLDHTRFLGSSVTDIAKEKAGIIKEETPIVIGESQKEISPIFSKIAKSKNSEIVFADKYEYSNYNCDLKGDYQKKNLKTVLKSSGILKRIGYKINDSHIEAGLNNVSNNTGFQGRWQLIQKEPVIICDTAHNISSLKSVINQLLKMNCNKIHYVLGFTNDKDLKEISKIFPLEGFYYFVKANIERGRSSNEIEKEFYLNKRIGNSFSTVVEGLNAAKLTANKNDIIFIGGSTFVVAEIL